MSKRVNSSNISMKTKSRKGSEVKRSKDSKDFEGSEGSKVSEGSTDVEEVRKDVTVGLSVGLSVTKSYHTSRVQIFLIFGQKLDIKILRTPTRPDYPKKIWIIQ